RDFIAAIRPRHQHAEQPRLVQRVDDVRRQFTAGLDARGRRRERWGERPGIGDAIRRDALVHRAVLLRPWGRTRIFSQSHYTRLPDRMATTGTGRATGLFL